MEQWQQFQEKFLQITPREQYIVVLAGFFLICYLPFMLVLEPNFAAVQQHQQKIKSLTIANKTAKESIELFTQALASDPNLPTRKQIARLETKLKQVDEKLLALTSDLINPIQMRIALIELLNLHAGVSLVSFEVAPAEALLVEQPDNKPEAMDKTAEIDAKVSTPTKQRVGLYRHSITLKLSGQYSALQQYLRKLEQLSWKFFWQEFDYKVVEYPKGEVQVTLYSLSTKSEFIGV